MANQIIIRRFTEGDAAEVREMFITVNRLLAPEGLRDDFESYITLSLREEIDRISEYYQEKNGSFWVALIDAKVVGMFGLEQSSDGAMELRRMYVAPGQRRNGIGRRLLHFAEEHCRLENVNQLHLSTSETQPEALSLYHNSGFELVREEIAETATNKTIGGGIRRYYFKKDLSDDVRF